MTDTDRGEGSESLEVIDLGWEPHPTARASRQRRPGARSRGWAVATALACVAVLGAALVVGSRGGSAHAVRRVGPSTPTTSGVAIGFGPPPPTRGTTSIHRPRGLIVGDLYPALAKTDSTTLVMPSGLTIRLSGGLTRAIGGLGAMFGGSVSPKDTGVCCTLSFRIFHAAPAAVFDSLGTRPVSSPELVPANRARLGDLKALNVQYGLLSTGDWTLTASFGDGGIGTTVNRAVLSRMRKWRLRSTPHGAVLEVPDDSTIDVESVEFGRNPDLSERQVELDQNATPCASGTATPRTIARNAYESVGSWCEHGLTVNVVGPPTYVEGVVHDLEITVKPGA